MKRHHWLIIAALSLLGMFFVPMSAYAGGIEIVPNVIPAGPIIPVVTLPGTRLPFPSSIPGAPINLPAPTIPMVSLPGRIQVMAFVAPQQENKGVFASAQKAFAAAPGASGPNGDQLNVGFDKGSAPAGSVQAGSVDEKDVKKPEPKKKVVQRARVIQVPTWELENEIGI